MPADNGSVRSTTMDFVAFSNPSRDAMRFPSMRSDIFAN
jgi:hypothetical protein